MIRNDGKVCEHPMTARNLSEKPDIRPEKRTNLSPRATTSPTPVSIVPSFQPIDRVRVLVVLSHEHLSVW